jgi:hypothetical protein
MSNYVTAPAIDGRRRAALLAMLEQLVPACLPDWRVSGGQGDIAQAILSVAASLEAEVTQRLDRVPEKQFRNFLDWIGVRRDPARAARLYGVLLTTPGTAAAVLGTARLRLQAQTPDGPIVFETEQDLLVVPGVVADLVAVDGANDKLYLPPAGLLTAAAPSPPVTRVLAGPAPVAAKVVQVTPALGLAAGQSIGIGGTEYRVTDVKGELIGIDPKLDAAVQANDPVVAVSRLIPFPPGKAGDTAARNWQSHEFYVGASDLLNIDSDATIVLHGGDLLASASWTYWGLADGASAPDWLKFDTTPAAGTLTLAKRNPSKLPKKTMFGQTSRWLRAVAASPQKPITLLEGLDLSVSAEASALDKPIQVDALANTVPLVTTTEFFPLGREPRLFDQFYVSAPEAMSKKNAIVTLNFDAADESFGPLVAMDGVAFAVRRDGALAQIGLTQIDLTRNTIAAPVVAAQSRPVLFDSDRTPSVAVLTASTPVIYHFAYAALVSQEKQVWLWRGWNTPSIAGYAAINWVPLDAPDGILGPVAVAAATGPNIVVLAAVKDTLFLRTLTPFSSTPAAGWQSGASLTGTDIAQIAVIRRAAGDHPEKVLLVGADGSLWLLDDPTSTAPVQFIGINVATDIAPASLWNGAGAAHIVTADKNNVPFAITATPAAPQQVTIDGARMVADGGGFGLVQDTLQDRPIVLFRPQDLPRAMVVWPVGDLPLPDETITEDADLRGSPILVRATPGGTARAALLVPAINRAVYSRDWADPEPLTVPEADLRDGVRLAMPPQTLGLNEGPALLESLPANRALRSVYRIEQQVPFAGDHLFRPSMPFATVVGPNWRLLMPTIAVLSGTVAGAALTLDAADVGAAKNDVILIGTGLAGQSFDDALSFRFSKVVGGVATLSPTPVGSWITNGPVQYQHVRASAQAGGTIFPTLANVPQNQRQSLLDRGLLAAATPDHQVVLGNPADAFLVLQAPWTVSPQVVSGQISFAIPPAAPQPWNADQQPVVANPELSWEYWNGSSWWLLELTGDRTRNLIQSGPITFVVPDDFAATDVAGRNQLWIRARLTGGDYGKEIYKLTTDPDKSQTAERDTSQIHPPRMLGLKVGYTLQSAQAPEFLMTVDSLGLHDQSAANRLPGAIVTAFQPVGDMLVTMGPDPAAAPSRALFLGIQAGAPPQAGVIRLLALVREQASEVRLIAETLRDGLFLQLPLSDDTGGLGQDGLLSIALDAPLQLAALFGAERYWLRLRPRKDDPGLGTWQPVLEGLYLNATSAEAAETQDFELLGTSDGSPAQRVTLARPPILAGSLDLRVREPLADEDIAALRIGDPERVRTDIPGRPGSWVRWNEVADVADAGPGERVYRLDHATGDIFFGDAQAGMVPPLGRDCIAALSYRRVGRAAANQVAAWTSLTLVTTLPGVEQVLAPRPAAGGADPASDAATLADAPAALRNRGRAITGSDLEAIALSNTPEFCQARFIQNGRAARLIAVANGRDPIPGKAQRETLRARLAAVTLPRLSAQGGLAVDPPVLRPLAVEAALTVENFGIGGTVDAAARGALEQLLDPASGGVDGRGWPLGAMPGDADMMAVLDGIDGLVGVASLVVSDIGDGGKLQAPPRAFAADELAVLAPDRLVLSLQAVTP